MSFPFSAETKLAGEGTPYSLNMRSARLSGELASDEAIELYLRLSNQLRTEHPDSGSAALTWREAEMLVNLIDAWRAHEHRKHIALKHALGRASRRLRAERGDQS